MKSNRLHAAWNGTSDWQGFGIPMRAAWSGFMDLTKHRGCSLVVRATGRIDQVHVILKGQECEKESACNQSGNVPLTTYRRASGEIRIPLTAFEGSTLPTYAVKQVMFGTWKRTSDAEMDIEFPIRIE